MKKSPLLLSSLFILSACGGGTPYSFNQPGISQEQIIADFDECQLAAEDASNGVRSPYVDYSGSTASVAAGSFASGFMKGMEKSRIKREVRENCLVQKGYAKTWLTDEEYENFKAARDDSKDTAKQYLYDLAAQERAADRFVNPDANK